MTLTVRLNFPVSLLCAVCLLLVEVRVNHASAQSVNLIQNRKVRKDNELYRFDQSSIWALHLKSSVVVHSSLLRLKDVATPIEENPPWWDRVGNSIIAMMPLNEHEVVIERTRLDEALARSTAVATIQWSGEQQVRVTFKPPTSDNHLSPPSTQRPNHFDVTQAAARMPVKSATDSNPGNPPAEISQPSLPPISVAERERIVRFIQVGIDRYDVSLRASYDITVDPNQDGVSQLRDLRQIDSVKWDTEPGEGMRTAEVTIRNQKQVVTAMVEVQFAARPMVVVAREGLRRGHVISSSDVELAPAERNLSTDHVITSIDDVIGLQVQSVLARGKPILRNQVGQLMLIERGDLVEVRVVGGGITIATSARALDRGAQGTLIPIETLEPRKKLMARVSAPGIVEIITRPPRIQ